jgi:hypothetical protein
LLGRTTIRIRPRGCSARDDSSCAFSFGDRRPAAATIA